MQLTIRPTGLAVISVALLTALASAQGSLTTTFASNNGGSTNWGNYFDVDVKNPKGLKITSFDVNDKNSVNSTTTIDIYITPNTYVGNDTNSAVWFKVATGSGTAKGRNNPTPVNTADFFLAPGKYGMFVHFVSGAPAYTDGTNSNRNYSNKDLALALGIVRTVPWGGLLFSPRVWNGTIYYDADDKAANGAHGFPCPGTNNMSPVLSLSAEPILGTSPNFSITKMPNTVSGGGLFFIGLRRTQTDLTPIGMPKCALFNDALVTLGFGNINGSASVGAPIPNDKALVGAIVHTQAANPDKGANLLGMAATNGLSIRIGNK